MFIDINETKLFYEKQGNGQPIILLHGNGEDHTIFNEITPQLTVNNTVYLLDSRGHGQSASAKVFNYETMANDVACFITELNLQKPVLYGFSDGGIIGLILASKHPDMLSKLIVSGVNTYPQGIKNSVLLMFKIKYFFTRSPLLKMMIKQPEITKSDLEKIKIPTIILVGQNDLIKVNHTRFIAQHIADSNLEIIANEDHGSYVVHTPKLYDIIKPFLNAST